MPAMKTITIQVGEIDRISFSSNTGSTGYSWMLASLPNDVYLVDVDDNNSYFAKVRDQLAKEYTYNVASPFLAAERGELDGIIEPSQTRTAIIRSLRALKTKRASLPPKKHGNIPL